MYFFKNNDSNLKCPHKLECKWSCSERSIFTFSLINLSLLCDFHSDKRLDVIILTVIFHL